MTDLRAALEEERQGRIGDWMQTRSGRAFWPLDPRPGDFAIADIAWGLAHVCRYGGHVLRFYSVAEHSVLASFLVPEGDRLAALMHDASEAYLGDVVRPLKRALPEYKAIEERVERAIAEQFGIAYPWSAAVKVADEAMLARERRDVMPDPPFPWKDDKVPQAAITIRGWSPTKAATMFVARYMQLQGDDSALLAASDAEADGLERARNMYRRPFPVGWRP